MLSELDIESPFDLMGLYQGVSLDKKSVMDLPRGPDMVFLYRRAMLDYWAEGERRWVISSPTCSCTKSAIISAYPTPIWSISRRKPRRLRCTRLTGARRRAAGCHRE